MIHTNKLITLHHSEIGDMEVHAAGIIALGGHGVDKLRVMYRGYDITAELTESQLSQVIGSLLDSDDDSPVAG